MAGEASFLATRASLLGRLRDIEDHPTWQEFFDTYWRLIYGTAGKAGLTPEEAQDAVQETFVAVARNIGRFRYDKSRCSFKSWLLLITRQRIIWQVRKRAPGAVVSSGPGPTDESMDGGVDRMAQLPDPTGDALDRIWEEEWQRHLMAAALERVKSEVSARQFQIFDLHVLQNWPVNDVARTLQVNAGQVYLAKHRVAGALKKAVRAVENGTSPLEKE
jgi:RNA polymerase sigma-70 factor (ECF subfamily)